MTLKSRVPGEKTVYRVGVEAAVSLASYQYTAVASSASASVREKITNVSSQGQRVRGILQNAPALAAEGDVMVMGRCQAIADSTFNSGVELTVSGADGKLEAASSGDWVCAFSVEPAVEADQRVAVDAIPGYYKD